MVRARRRDRRTSGAAEAGELNDPERERVGGVPKRRGETIRRELRILGENLLLRAPARSEFEQELDAEARATNTGLPAENLRIGDD